MDENKQPQTENIESTESSAQPADTTGLDYSDFADEPLAQDFSTDTNTVPQEPFTTTEDTSITSEQPALAQDYTQEPTTETTNPIPVDNSDTNEVPASEGQPLNTLPQTEDTLTSEGLASNNQPANDSETTETPTTMNEESPSELNNNETTNPESNTEDAYDPDSLMSEFGLDTDPEPNTEDNLNAGGEPPVYSDSPLAPPPSHQGGGKKMIALIAITLILFVVLLASIWYFFLRGSDNQQGPEPTPTITSLITPEETETHLECRFGLCVETPNVEGGDNSNQCSSSFDCEQAPSEPTATLTPGEEISPTVAATIIPNPSGTPETTNTPTPTIASSPSPTITNAPTPTNIPTPTPTPLTDTLPESGSTETTFMLFTLLSLLLIGGGYLAFVKND